MATRNRTVIFKRHRDALNSVRAPAVSPASTPSTSGGPVIELVSTSLLHSKRSYAPLSTEDPGTSREAVRIGLPPAWVDDSEEITVNVQKARLKISQLAKAHAKALLPSFGDGKAKLRPIESLTHEITDLLKKSETRLQKLSAVGPSDDSNVRKNVQRSLATDLQGLSMELRKQQSTYLKSLRQQKEGQYGGDLEMNYNDDNDTAHSRFPQQSTDTVKRKGMLTAEREREIEHISESVSELAQIMKDLSVMVIDQGTVVDRIDYTIQSVSTTVEDGLVQLKKAEQTQKQGGMAMCATVLIVMCFVMLVLLVLKSIL